MNSPAEILILEQILGVCKGHSEALDDALVD